jgi:hypothetical protein
MSFDIDKFFRRKISRKHRFILIKKDRAFFIAALISPRAPFLLVNLHHQTDRHTKEEIISSGMYSTDLSMTYGITPTSSILPRRMCIGIECVFNTHPWKVHAVWRFEPTHSRSRSPQPSNPDLPWGEALALSFHLFSTFFAIFSSCWCNL